MRSSSKSLKSPSLLLKVSRLTTTQITQSPRGQLQNLSFQCLRTFLKLRTLTRTLTQIVNSSSRSRRNLESSSTPSYQLSRHSTSMTKALLRSSTYATTRRSRAKHTGTLPGPSINSRKMKLSSRVSKAKLRQKKLSIVKRK